MASRAPTGWSTSRRAMHYKAVIPERDDGLFLNLHKRVKKSLLPKGSRDDEENGKIAKRILSRQRRIHEKQRQSRWNKSDSSNLDLVSYKPKYDSSVSTVAPSTSHLMHKRQIYLPPVGRTTCMTSDSSYTSDDIDRIVMRLTMCDLARVPESKGYVKITPQTKRRGKFYSQREVTGIVDRLSDFDQEKHPPESRGNTSAVRRIKEWKKQAIVCDN
ncbi:uncharacterized protein LOC125651096 [Ostrea edulis]|uniref:uncharacterized protein LOC125651096 n=1 Tax=Ostrea edulis TaxID=37623 RepID=UPI0020958983|nr:uncharacterized protein LOC125651096 [Ostrea edulis]